MRGEAFLAGTKDYLAALVSVILFPLAWFKSFRLAKKHQDDDPRGVAKVAVAIGASLVLTAVAAFMVVDFQMDAKAGMYDALDNRLSIATGNEDYKAAVEAGDDAEAARLQPNHDLYVDVSEAVQAQDDAEAKRLIAERSDAVADDEDLDQQAARAFAIKDDAVSDMNTVLDWFVYPGLVGVFFAPLVWAVGSILRNAWTPSESVGFKPYPHGAMALFLLLGAFGVPALFFVGWTFFDFQNRSVEGQIAL